MELLLAQPLAPQEDTLTQTMSAKIASQDASTAIITTLATNVISATSRLMILRTAFPLLAQMGISRIWALMEITVPTVSLSVGRVQEKRLVIPASSGTLWHLVADA